MSKAVIPGSYDPITNGHVALIRKAAGLFDSVTVLISVNSAKKGFLTTDAKKRLCEDACREIPNVQVTVFDGLFADFCHDNAIAYVVKGLRNASDYAYEEQLSDYNRQIFQMKQYAVPETLYLTADREYTSCSSTFVRELLHYHQSVKDVVPNAELLGEYLKENE